MTIQCPIIGSVESALEFALQLRDLGVPAPWRLHDVDDGGVLAANGKFVFEESFPSYRSAPLAMWIIMAVNTLAGFAAEPPR